MLGDNSELLAAMQQTLQQMNDYLETVCADVESLKCSQSPGGQGAQLPYGHHPSTLPSRSVPSVISKPDNVFGGDDDDNVATCLTWEEQMELEDDLADVDKVNKSGKCPKGEKLCLTKVEESTEDFLREAFKPMSIEDRKHQGQVHCSGRARHHSTLFR